ncbi:hypothetical protein PENSTE_c008G01707 [Penicillium steckii]|uniref:Uncharacterized protein n=1 Tax=Penicillium steckii TaxID=303698 RepID=A0A1V6TC65_9EURO|nr:hypothetical protein PENSTE_c008G01707 [Penicillium steckii]
MSGKLRWLQGNEHIAKRRIVSLSDPSLEQWCASSPASSQIEPENKGIAMIDNNRHPAYSPPLLEMTYILYILENDDVVLAPSLTYGQYAILNPFLDMPPHFQDLQ